MIEIAQENLQRDFLVVIVVERMGEGVQLLQTLLPSYFRGALQVPSLPPHVLYQLLYYSFVSLITPPPIIEIQSFWCGSS
jgi:hypothetical protein